MLLFREMGLTAIMIASVRSVNVRKYITQRKPIWNSVVLFYIFFGYIGAITLFFSASLLLNLTGVLLLTQSLVYSAYLTHEFMHGTIFRDRRWNIICGTVMLWLNGGCYYKFQSLTFQHLTHHKDKFDIFTFEPVAALQKQPSIVRQIILALEWCYFPVMGFWSRWQALTAPFWNSARKDERLRVIFILSIRAIFFTLLGILSIKALLLYFLSYVGMITVLRWADAFQHTYEGFSPDVPLPKRDRSHEEAHTFSTLLSCRYPWLNILLLNFGYHNAHHAVMTCPWYSLQELNRELDRESKIRYVSLLKQLRNYHKFRITRFLLGQGEAIDKDGKPTFDYFYGAHDVSFLFLY
jgi:fatty acid desaturase